MGLSVGGLPGNIPLQHEIEACNAANYQYWHSWKALEEDQRALLVAQYYTKLMIEAHKSDAAMTESERARRRSGAKKSRR